MVVALSLKFPRIGPHRDMKSAVEAFWKGEINESILAAKGQQIRRLNWGMQKAAGLELLPVGDLHGMTMYWICQLS